MKKAKLRPVTWLNPLLLEFPDPETVDSDGIVAVGGDMTPERLLVAYKSGIFPWYNHGDEPILWWSPDPRMVLYPDELKVSKSMRPYFNQQKFKVTYNKCFEKVMRNCMNTSRDGQSGSWINEDMISAYSVLNRWGFAHSVEVWSEDTLVGGLYGIAWGRVFFGESMFAHQSNASKFGFISFVQTIKSLGIQLIDCQQETPHLTSLGGRVISRTDFLTIIRTNEVEHHILKGVDFNSMSIKKI
ncbi:MAG: leucyl/phenylalanyl-tRNA--protein transferase [Saprospiraceae bacterium]|nr:leucyl/phenylalanyl-tRNA--protein transferase [Saprospiraceae bacterium]